jgi:hypothetical protein
MPDSTIPRLRILSLGAGVQSTTLALMYSRGELGPMPDAAIFADTEWERREVYEHLDRLERKLSFPIFRVRAGNIRQDIETTASSRTGRFASVPWFLRMPDGTIGMGRRQCTAHYKLEPIRKKVRELLGLPHPKPVPPGACELLIGISTDEAMRAKPSSVGYITNRHPLLDAGMSRSDCRRYLQERQEGAPKSACIGCPFHSNDMWRDLRDNSPDEWRDAVLMDRAIRNAGSLRGIRGQQFMHRSCVPLDQADLDRGNGPGDLFGNECEGMCGV